ncbi:hypothetical protein P692DRAFT_201031950 [Suillus brevipes Sb2]|nr:hypothetical protein P692DRAFT_201031950 [Suillus brevipes Sb2]
MPVPDQLMFQVSRTLTLRLAADLDSKSAHHAYHRFIMTVIPASHATDDHPKTLTTANFQPHLELMEPRDSLSAVLKFMFNLQRDSVEVWLMLQEQTLLLSFAQPSPNEVVNSVAQFPEYTSIQLAPKNLLSHNQHCGPEAPMSCLHSLF